MRASRHRIGWFSVCLVASLLMGVPSVSAQEDGAKKTKKRPVPQRETDGARPEKASAADPDDPTAEPVPYGRDFSRPYDDRPWRRPRYLDPPRRHCSRWEGRHRRSWHRYDYPDGRWRWDWGDGYDRYGGYTQADLDAAYQQGFDDGRDYERFEIQAERGYYSFTEAMDRGFETFESGSYALAARQFLLAARLNQRDPSSRLVAGLAQMAVGEYMSSALLIRRAMDLQPNLVYVSMDVRDAYGRSEDFRMHLRGLESAVEADPNSADLLMLLGYFRLFSDDARGAVRVLSAAHALAPEDDKIVLLEEVARASLSPEQRELDRPSRAKRPQPASDSEGARPRKVRRQPS